MENEPDASPWSFSVTFDLPRSRFVPSREPNEVAPPGEAEVLLHDGHGVRLNGDGTGAPVVVGGRMSIVRSGFPGQESAAAAAERMTLSVLLTSLRKRIGITFSGDAWSNGPVNGLAREFERGGIRIVDALGVRTFPAKQISHSLNAMALGDELDVEAFVSDAESFYRTAGACPTRAVGVALLLLNSALDERRLESGFLLAVSAIEALCPQIPIDDDAVLEDIEKACDAVKAAGLSGKGRERVLQSIRGIKNMGVRGRFLARIKQAAPGKSQDWGEMFDAIYRARSALTHEGSSPGDLSDLFRDAVGIALELIEHDIRAAAGQ